MQLARGDAVSGRPFVSSELLRFEILLFELNAKTSNGLLGLKPDHCSVEAIQIYTVPARKSGARRKTDGNVSRDAAGKVEKGSSSFQAAKSQRPPGGGHILKNSRFA